MHKMDKISSLLLKHRFLSNDFILCWYFGPEADPVPQP